MVSTRTAITDGYYVTIEEGSNFTIFRTASNYRIDHSIAKAIQHQVNYPSEHFGFDNFSCERDNTGTFQALWCCAANEIHDS